MRVRTLLLVGLILLSSFSLIRISDSLDNKIPGPTERVAAEADCD